MRENRREDFPQGFLEEAWRASEASPGSTFSVLWQELQAVEAILEDLGRKEVAFKHPRLLLPSWEAALAKRHFVTHLWGLTWTSSLFLVFFLPLKVLAHPLLLWVDFLMVGVFAWAGGQLFKNDARARALEEEVEALASGGLGPLGLCVREAVGLQVSTAWALREVLWELLSREALWHTEAS